MTADLPSPSVEGGEPTTEAGRGAVALMPGSLTKEGMRRIVIAIEAEARAPTEATDLHPRTYSLVGGGLDMFLVTDDESGMNIGYARKIGGPLTAPIARAGAASTEATPPHPDHRVEWAVLSDDGSVYEVEGRTREKAEYEAALLRQRDEDGHAEPGATVIERRICEWVTAGVGLPRKHERIAVRASTEATPPPSALTACDTAEYEGARKALHAAAHFLVATAKGWLRFLPEPLRRWAARRTLRAIMALQGVPLDGLSDAKVDAGIARFKTLGIGRPDLVMAPSLRDLIRDAGAAPEEERAL